MSRRRDRRKGILHRRCDEVLHYLWDPIGVAGEPYARDEYESYVPHVCALLQDGAGEDAIAEYLGSAAREAMGLEPNGERDLQVARVLLDWAEKLNDRPMTESDFWLRLEFRLCREMDGNRDWQRLGLWCDGIYPQVFQLESPEPVIEGEAWIGLGPKGQEQWSFRLVLPQAVEDRAAIAWDRVLPAADVTGWLSLDRERREMKLEPGLAVPDEE